jgi:hypothetical protein
MEIVQTNRACQWMADAPGQVLVIFPPIDAVLNLENVVGVRRFLNMEKRGRMSEDVPFDLDFHIFVSKPPNLIR